MDTQAGHQPVHLSDYLSGIYRRKLLVTLTLVIGVGAAATLAVVLPSIYRSSATIVIESQEIPEQFVAATINLALRERVQGISLRLLTHANLWGIAEKLDLYPEDRLLLAENAIVGRMRNNTKIEIVNYQASGAETAKQAVTTLALRISFDSETPRLAQQTASELTALFLQENQDVRSERATDVADFLARESDKLRTEISILEKNLAVFKEKHVEELPELADVNLRLAAQTEEKLERTQEKIRSLEDRMLALNAQITITDPYKDVFSDTGKRIQSGSERLNVLVSEYLRLSSNYAQDHPDITRLRREIQSLDGQVAGGVNIRDLVRQVKTARENLSTAQQKYSEQHPDVRKLAQAVTAAEKRLREIDFKATAEPEQPEAPVSRPDNPAYIALQTQLATIVANLEAENTRVGQLTAKLAEYEARIQKTPAVEREYLELTRDYDNAVNKYDDLRDKLLEAQLGVELEKDAKAERMTLVQRPRVPTEPESPNRKAIVLIGFALGLIGGIGNATVVEYFDHSVRGARGIRMAMNAPPIAIIPYIDNQFDLRRRRRRWAQGSVAVAGLAGLILFGVHTYVMPMAELWVVVLGKLGIETAA